MQQPFKSALILLNKLEIFVFAGSPKDYCIHEQGLWELIVGL